MGKMRKSAKMKKRLCAAAMMTVLSTWVVLSGNVSAATAKGEFYAGLEKVSANISGDENQVMASTSYTRGPGTLYIRISGSAQSRSNPSLMQSIVSWPGPTNAPGGASTTMTPPSGYRIMTATSYHGAELNGGSGEMSLTLF